MPRPIVAVVTNRPLLRQAVVPLATFAGVVVAGVAGFVFLGDIGAVEAAFWLVDLTSVEPHFADSEGPATATKAYAVLVTAGLVVTGRWVGETVLSAAFGGRCRRNSDTCKPTDSLRVEMAENSRRMREKHSWANVSDRYLDLYERAIVAFDQSR